MQTIDDFVKVIRNDSFNLLLNLNPHTREKAGLAFSRLEENLLRLEIRYKELIDVENRFIELKQNRGKLKDIQLSFVDKTEAFHQQVYSTISVLILVLSHIGITGTKQDFPRNSVQKYLGFLKQVKTFNDKFHKNSDILLRSVRFRAEFIDHPQSRPAYEWMTYGFAGRYRLIYFRRENINKVTNIFMNNDLKTLNPDAPEFNVSAISTSEFFISPNADFTYGAILVLIRVLLFHPPT